MSVCLTSTITDRNHSNRSHTEILFWIATIVVALLACRLRMASQAAWHSMTRDVHQGLQYTVLTVLEEQRVHRLEHDRASILDGQRHNYTRDAETNLQAAQEDAVTAEWYRVSGETNAALSAWEEEQAGEAQQQWNRDDRSRLDLLHNLTAEQDKLQQLQQQDRDRRIHQCTKLWTPLCNSIGYLSQLPPLLFHEQQQQQQQEQAEAARIVQDTQRLDTTRHAEYLDALVVSILTHDAHQTNATATVCLTLAEAYDHRARTEARNARHANETAQRLRREGMDRRNRLRGAIGRAQRDATVATRALQAGRVQQRWGCGYAVAAVAVALTALGMVGLRWWWWWDNNNNNNNNGVGAHCVWMVQSWWRGVWWNHNNEENDDDSRTVGLWYSYGGWHSIGYGTVHGLVFATCVGLSAEYLVELDEYDTLRRAVSILWFAYLGGGLQTIGLHSMPHVLAAWRCHGTVSDLPWRDLATQFLLRFASLLIWFVLEFLIVWLTVRHVVLTEAAILWQSRHWCGVAGLTLGTTALYLYLLEPRHRIARGGDDDQTTVFCEDESENDSDSSWSEPNMSTESSPLTFGSGHSTMDSQDFPSVYFAGLRRAAEWSRSHVSLAGGSAHRTTSAYHMNVGAEARNLVLALDLLLTIAMVSIVCHSVHSLWIHPWIAIAILSSWALEVVTIYRVVIETSFCTPTHYEEDSQESLYSSNAGSSKMIPYSSIA